MNIRIYHYILICKSIEKPESVLADPQIANAKPNMNITDLAVPELQRDFDSVRCVNDR